MVAGPSGSRPVSTGLGGSTGVRARLAPIGAGARRLVADALDEALVAWLDKPNPAALRAALFDVMRNLDVE